jgi:hypothetical protein
MSEARQTVAGAYLRLEGHERECALRYEALGKGISDLAAEQGLIKSGLRAGLWMLATIAVSLIAWLALQVYELNRADAARPPPPTQSEGPANVSATTVRR